MVNVKELSGSQINYVSEVNLPLNEAKIYFNPIQDGEGVASPENVREIRGWDGITVYGFNKRLPDEYVEVEWLESTGTQWIEVPLTETLDVFRATCEFMYTKLPSINNMGEICGIGTLGIGLKPSERRVYIINNSQTYGYARMGIALDQKYALDASQSGTDLLLKINSAVSTGVTSYTDLTGSKIFLFAQRENIFLADLKLYNFTAYNSLDDSEPIRNLIPCYRISDHTPGMWDTVTSTFYTNSGTGDFILGPEVGITIDFPKTIYGGYVDLVRGEIIETYDIISSYDSETLDTQWLSDRDEYEEGTLPTTGAQVAYELATPNRYPISPHDLRLLKGSNSFSSNSNGDIAISFADSTYEQITGNTVSFDAPVAGKPLEECKIYFTPKQDLHGYSKPWVGGAGKNKVDYLDSTNWIVASSPTNRLRPNEGTFSVTDNVITMTRTHSQYGLSILLGQLKADVIYTLSAIRTNTDNKAYIAILDSEIADSYTCTRKFTLTHSNNAVTFTPTEDGIYEVLYWNNNANAISISNLQLEESSSATSYEPYSNICPIEGWDGITVDVGRVCLEWENTGTNSQWSTGYFLSNGIISSAVEGYTYTPEYIDISNTSSITFSFTKNTSDSAWYRLVEYDGDKNILNVIDAYNNSRTFTPTNGTKYIRLSCNNSSVATLKSSDVTTYTIQFPQTVYGGYVDLVNGEVVATWTRRKVSNLGVTKTGGSGVWAHRFDVRPLWRDGGYEEYNLPGIMCDMLEYNSAANRNNTFLVYSYNYIDVYDDTVSTAAEFKTKWADCHFAYPLASSKWYYTYSLTDLTTLTTLRGHNTIWTSANGNITVRAVGEVTSPLRSDVLYRRQINSAPHIESVSGSSVQFSTDMETLLKEGRVYFSPKQDLHGYDKPWIGGAVNNMIPDGTDTNNGYVNNHYLISDGTINSNIDTAWYISEYFNVVEGNQYTWSSLKPANVGTASVCFYNENKEFISGEAGNGELPKILTAPQGSVYCRVSQRHDSTYLCQFEAGSTATTILPYSNVCPIEGWDGITFIACGKNLFNKNNKGYYNARSGAFVNNSSYSYWRFPVKQGDIVRIRGGGHGLGCYFKDGEYVGKLENSTTITVPSGVDEITSNFASGYIQNDIVTLNNSDTSYEPYQGATITIPFPSKTKNLYDVSTPITRSQYTTAGIYENVKKRIMTDFIPITEGQTYTMNIDSTADNLAFINYNLFDENKNWLGERTKNGESVSFSGATTHTFTVNLVGSKYLKIVVRDASDPDASIESKTLINSKLQLETGPSATSYVDFNNIYYGGYVDLINGEVVETMKSKTLRSCNFGQYSNTNRCWSGNIQDMKLGKDLGNDLMCDSYNTYTPKSILWGGVDKAIWGYSTSYSGQIIIRDDDYIKEDGTYDMAAFYAFLENVNFIYPLATPNHIPLTDPFTIRTLVGTNTLISTSNGDIAVSYYRHGDDITQYIPAQAIATDDNYLIVTEDGYIIGEEEEFTVY